MPLLLTFQAVMPLSNTHNPFMDNTRNPLRGRTPTAGRTHSLARPSSPRRRLWLHALREALYGPHFHAPLRGPILLQD